MVELMDSYHESYSRRPNANRSDLARIKRARDLIAQVCPYSSSDVFGLSEMRGIRDLLLTTTYVREGKKVHVSRSYINKLLSCIRTAIRWGCQEGYCDETTWARSRALPSLLPNQTLATEGYPHHTVAEEELRIVQEYSLSIHGDIYELLWLCGARPSEVLSMRLQDIEEIQDPSGTIRVYTPQSHKNKHRGKDRVIAFTEKEWELIKPYADDEEYIFTPRKAYVEQKDIRARNRRTPASPSHIHDLKGENDIRIDGFNPHISVNNLGSCLRHACKMAVEDKRVLKNGKPFKPFTLYDLRHTRATENGRTFGKMDANTNAKLLGNSPGIIAKIYDHSTRDVVLEMARRRASSTI